MHALGQLHGLNSTCRVLSIRRPLGGDPHTHAALPLPLPCSPDHHPEAIGSTRPVLTKPAPALTKHASPQSNLELKAFIPMGILCTVLYFFPRILLSLVGLFVLWMLWPLLRQARPN